MADFVFTILTLEEDDTFTLPIYDGGTYDFNVDWGDSSNDDITAWDDAAVTHTYADAGPTEYTITIRGTITGWRFVGAGDCTLMKDIQSFGPLNLGNLGYYFYGCTNLTISATDNLDLIGTTTLESIFRNCSSLTTVPSMNDWDVSSINSFNNVFRGASAFNQDLSSLDVSSAITMSGTFRVAISFDQNLGSWVIVSVTSMTLMFNGVTLSTANYDAILIGWEGQAVEDNVVFDGGNSKYSAGAAATAKQALIDDHSWVITDGGADNYFAVQGGSRILNASRVDQSGADDADVIDWTKTDDFILAVNINSGGEDTDAAQYKLRWRDVTDVGSFADVGATGEIHYNADTDLVNGAAILVAGRKCDSQGGDTWQNGKEVEGASLSDSIDLPDEYETEIHFALDCSGAQDGHKYEFELYNSTGSYSRGTCGATITIYGEAEIYNAIFFGMNF